MKKITILISFLGILIGLSSCGVQPGPRFILGNYYWIDNNCVKFRQLTATSIACANSDEVPTGYRNAMTDQQLGMYRHNQAMNQRQRIADQERRDRKSESFDRQLEKQRENLNKQINNLPYGYP